MTSDLHQTFMIVQDWSSAPPKMLVSTHMNSRKHAKHKCAHHFFMSSAAILKPFLTENEKMEAIHQIGIDEVQLFHFINFFLSVKEVLQNG